MIFIQKMTIKEIYGAAVRQHIPARERKWKLKKQISKVSQSCIQANLHVGLSSIVPHSFVLCNGLKYSPIQTPTPL
jgi:hypothetical protein